MIQNLCKKEEIVPKDIEKEIKFNHTISKIEQQDQIVKNKELEKTEGWDALDYKEKAKRGYDSVSEWHSGGGYSDSKTNFSSKLAEELRQPLVDQEED